LHRSAGLRRLARETGGHLYIPSGAIGGLDALKAIPSTSIHEVRLTTTKNPANFKGCSYTEEKGIDLDAITEPTVIFDGNAGDAVKAFPRNINVSAILSYAGIGRENTHVVIVADPAMEVNRHEVFIKSDHGEVRVEVNNVPFEINPRTSRLAAFSILAAVKSLVYTITIG
jgi:aspartate dehydrogenase